MTTIEGTQGLTRGKSEDRSLLAEYFQFGGGVPRIALRNPFAIKNWSHVVGTVASYDHREQVLNRK